MAGTFRIPLAIIFYRSWTPVVVSLEMPRMPDRICGYLVWMRLVRSPPSSRIMLRGPPLKYSVCSVHHRYSSSVSPFQAYLGMPALAVTAAAWSRVEKMLQLDCYTSAAQFYN